jgi:hypothetical protein
VSNDTWRRKAGPGGELWGLLAGLLELGNVRFQNTPKESNDPAVLTKEGTAAIANAANYLRIDPTILETR